jgi:hypothetical protein
MCFNSDNLGQCDRSTMQEHLTMIQLHASVDLSEKQLDLRMWSWFRKHFIWWSWLEGDIQPSPSWNSEFCDLSLRLRLWSWSWDPMFNGSFETCEKISSDLGRNFRRDLLTLCSTTKHTHPWDIIAGTSVPMRLLESYRFLSLCINVLIRSEKSSTNLPLH